MILHEVWPEPKNIDKYKKVVGREVVGGLKTLSHPLQGKRVIHVNSTDRGGGVAEILHSLVPLQQSLGVESKWYIVNPPPRFFEITKRFHNALQGAEREFSKDELDYYLKISKQFGEALYELEADLFIIHDPQPLAAWHFFRLRLAEDWLEQDKSRQSENNGPGSKETSMPHAPRAISRIHIDLSDPNKQLLEFLLPYLKEYDKVIFSLNSFVPRGIPASKVAIIPPAIDPLTPKNKPMNLEDAKNILKEMGVDVSRPVIAQVSRFDPWKDPIGVIDAYRLAKKRIPGLQLMLLGNATAKDDPESAVMVKQVREHAGDDPDIYLINIDSDVLVNAAQTGADVVLQKSIREGFGLTVTEALWKGKPVVAGNVGGLALQIDNPHNGILVEKPNTAADAIVKLLKNKSLADDLGEKGRQAILKNYLITRLLRDHHQLYQNLI